MGIIVKREDRHEFRVIPDAKIGLVCSVVIISFVNFGSGFVVSGSSQ
jgi:hypothetical protein